MAPHGTGNGLLGLAALVQVCATLPDNYIAFEYPIGEPEWWYEIVEGLPDPIVQGRLHRGLGPPGHGGGDRARAGGAVSRGGGPRLLQLIRGLAGAQGRPRTRWAIAEIAKRIIATKKMIFAIETAVPATPPKPRMAAISAMIRSVRAHPSIRSLLGWRVAATPQCRDRRRVPCGGGSQGVGARSGARKPWLRVAVGLRFRATRAAEARHADARSRSRHSGAQGRDRAAAAGGRSRRDAVIHDPAEVRAYECDALTAYRCPPLAVVLPASTAEVAAVLRVCHAEGVPVVPRGSGTSLAGGALPTADCVLLGVARMNRVLETDYENRVIRVETGRTNLSVTGAVEEEGFFYAPDPSSQLACAIAGNIAMNSGGAHCLKYGVTTNNLLGVTMVLMDGTVVELGGAHLDAPGLRPARGGLRLGGAARRGDRGDPADPAEARGGAAGADGVRLERGRRGPASATSSRPGVLPVAIEFMDRPCIRACEDFAHAGYPDVEALLIVEVEGSEAGDRRAAGQDRGDRRGGTARR